MDDFNASSRDVALVELLDRIVDHGVVLSGDITISVADVDLIYLGLRVLLRTPLDVDTMAPSSGAARSDEDTDDFTLHLRNSARRG